MKIPGAVKAMLMLAGMALAVAPMMAQQEVNPDHYDDAPAVVQKHAPRATKPAKPAATHVAAKPKAHKNKVAKAQGFTQTASLR